MGRRFADQFDIAEDGVIAHAVRGECRFGQRRRVGHRLVAELKHVFEIQALVTFRYFWRDNVGNEVDLLIRRGGILTPVDFKSGATFQPDWLASLNTWQRHAAQARQGEPLLISGAPGNQRLQGVGVAHWRDALMALAQACPAALACR